MKNILAKYCIALIALWALQLSVSAQTKPVNSITQKKLTGRNISIKLKPLSNCKVYIGSYYGKNLVLVDSTLLDGSGQGVFKGDTKFTSGVYFVVTPQITKQFEFLMDDIQHFSIEGDTTIKEKATITGSQENDLFKAYIGFSSDKGQQLQNIRNDFNAATTKADSTRLADEYAKIDKLVEDYRADIVKKYPGSLLTMLFCAMKRPVAPAIPIVNGRPDSAAPYRFVKNHFWDDVLFNDDRLLRTPFFETKLDEYFKFYVSAEPDSLIEEVKYMLLMAKTGKEIYPYLLTKFTNKYMAPEFMGQDKVFVYLFENFYAKGDTVILNPASRKTVTERAYSLMANQLGLPAPALDLVDSTGKAVSLYNVPSTYTMVVFYDPNCGHCKEELPRLDSFYRAKWKAVGMTMLGVNIYDAEQVAWKKFVTEKKLKNWIHAYQTKAAKEADEKAGRANYRQLYDIYKTPTVYLLDKDKRIIAKQLTVEQFDDIIEVKSKKQPTK
jgi:peroxiredoxin